MDGSTNHGFDWDLETLTTETFRFFKTLNMEQTMSIARNPKINPKNGHVYRRFPKKDLILAILLLHAIVKSQSLTFKMNQVNGLMKI
jgi:hypothetical protein